MLTDKLTLLTVLLGMACAGASPQLPSGKAPFQPRQSIRKYDGDAVLDQEKLTYRYGSKQLKINPDGTCSILSSGRELAKTYFFIATPFKYWQTNQGGTKKNGEYQGGRIEVRDIGIEGNKITVNGLVPWQKAGETVIPGAWRMTVTPLGKGRFAVHYGYDLPEGQKRRDSGIFMNVSNIKEADTGKAGIWVPKNKNKLHGSKPTVLKLKGNVPEDDFDIESSSWTASAGLRFSFRTGKSKNQPAFVIDLGESLVQSAEVRKPGGVDLMAVDALETPERKSRNLLPNPYFAAKKHFLVQYRISDEDKFSQDARFGRYSLNVKGGCRIATIPADAGDYVFSFYAKGKGIFSLGIRSAGGAGNAFQKRFSCKIKSPADWKRYEIPFHFPKDNALVTELRVPEGILLDGLQLEKGKRATEFDAPKVEAGAIGDFFFESGKPVRLKFELSTLEKEITGQGIISIRNFFGEEVWSKNFDYRLAAGSYPELGFDPGALPDGIYVAKLDYGPAATPQFFRFSVMPFLKNTHPTARVFSLGYFGHVPLMKTVSERLLARMQAIGIGSHGHACWMTGEVLDRFAKYNIIPFDSACGGTRRRTEQMKKLFPDLKNIPSGRTWFCLQKKEKTAPGEPKGQLPDYRLTGGWNENYKRKFKAEIARRVSLNPKRFAYRFASEWPREIKDDPHYIDLYAAYREAVKSVYPDALVYEAGDCNMDIYGGTACYDRLLTRMEGKTVTDFAATHTYVKDIRLVYNNFRAFVDMLKKHKGYEKCRMAFPEGMHFYPYNIPAWGMEQICWMGEGWRGTMLSYDLGWSEKISAAYYARCWLAFLTEFDRVWCATSSASNTGNFVMDDDLTPRAFQKIPNTLGVLLGNPKRWLGDFTFAPDTRCLVWEDEKGCPLAAVWNEDPAVNSGYKDAPKAKMNYPGAEYIDLMGAARKPEIDGEFPVSPFPLFIRGKAGDCGNFVKAISVAVLDDPDKLPCRIGFELKSAAALRLSLVNPLARPLNGSLKIFGREHRLAIPKLGEQNIDIELPQKIRPGQLEKLLFPYECVIDCHTIKQNLELNCFAVPKFTGDWKKIPAVRLTNRTGKNRTFTDEDFSAAYQLAWDEKKMYLRVTVKDNVFSPGNTPGCRWNYDVVQIFFDTRCSAMKTGRKTFDDDDYDYALMPTSDGKRCEVWRALSPDIQLTLGIGAPANNTMAPEIPAKFARTGDGYVYEAEFPADYLLPIRLTEGYNFAFGIYAADKDNGKGVEKGLSNTAEPGTGGWNKPHLWPIGVLTE